MRLGFILFFLGTPFLFFWLGQREEGGGYWGSGAERRIEPNVDLQGMNSIACGRPQPLFGYA